MNDGHTSREHVSSDSRAALSLLACFSTCDCSCCVRHSRLATDSCASTRETSSDDSVSAPAPMMKKDRKRLPRLARMRLQNIAPFFWLVNDQLSHALGFVPL